MQKASSLKASRFLWKATETLKLGLPPNRADSMSRAMENEFTKSYKNVDRSEVKPLRCQLGVVSL